ncbi:hypothetical protein [Achromobacter sp.]|uniref:hypothetical protein n=1 Tax=Achromobacter sp. TaxID=134375 RepID=UPI0028ABEF4D|nr:hypothetical protein [Achromobacter sp.]
MAAHGLDEKGRFCIVVALTAGSSNPERRARQDAQGRRLGLTRAEIDAARRGFSFDFCTSKAIALALAQDEAIRVSRRRDAIRAGIDNQACAEIERMAVKLLAPPIAKRTLK